MTLAAAVGCTGVVGDMPGPGAPTGEPPDTTSPTRPGTQPGTTPGSPTNPGTGAPPVVPALPDSSTTRPPGTPPPVQGVAWSPRFVRLTHTQYDNTVSALFGKPVDLGRSFPADIGIDEFDNNGDVLAVGDGLMVEYREAAEALSAKAVSDPDIYKRLVPCAPGPACAATFIDTFGLQAFRRPLTDVEKKTFATLHGRGAELVGTGDAFKDGVQLVVEAMLSSVDFLYRIELSRQAGTDGLVALSDWEKASRLSYAIWSSMPDQALFDAARMGLLKTPEQLAAQVQRMVESTDPAQKALLRRTVTAFHEQWLELDTYGRIKKDAKLFPAFTDAIVPALRTEIERFTEAMLVDRNLGVAGILTSTSSYLDKPLAALYGVTGTFSSTSFKEAELPAAERAGLITRIGVLASNSHQVETSPVFRGVFVRRHLLCDPPVPPPAGIDLTPPKIEGDVRTRRQQVAKQTTSGEPCRTCHEGLNEFGYALESYDAAGRFRTRENNEPLDTKVRVNIDGKPVDVDGPLQLSKALADSGQARACYAKTWLRYLLGRPIVDTDAATIGKVAEGTGLRPMLTAAVSSKTFTHRAPDPR